MNESSQPRLMKRPALLALASGCRFRPRSVNMRCFEVCTVLRLSRPRSPRFLFVSTSVAVGSGKTVCWRSTKNSAGVKNDGLSALEFTTASTSRNGVSSPWKSNLFLPSNFLCVVGTIRTLVVRCSCSNHSSPLSYPGKATS